jgi:hypothetical protein
VNAVTLPRPGAGRAPLCGALAPAGFGRRRRDGLVWRATGPASAPRARPAAAVATTERSRRPCGGGIGLGWKAVSPSVDFTKATTPFLADDPAALPPTFAIAGLTYDRLGQRSTRYPYPPVRGGELTLWLFNLAALLGWLLSSIFVLALARLPRNP